MTATNTAGASNVRVTSNGFQANATITVSGVACHITINEVQATGSGGTNDEFVELFNPCSTTQNIVANWTLRTRTGTTAATQATIFTFGATTMTSRSFRVYVGSTYSAGGTTDGTFAAGNHLPAAGIGVALFTNTNALVDQVAYGTTTSSYANGTHATAPGTGQSISRTPFDGSDLDNDSTDFHVVTSTPRATNL